MALVQASDMAAYTSILREQDDIARDKSVDYANKQIRHVEFAVSFAGKAASLCLTNGLETRAHHSNPGWVSARRNAPSSCARRRKERQPPLISSITS
jgi:hypothetical protein